MARYFLDTGPIVGITFLHDLWRTESERLFDTDNTLYTCQTAVYEYCNRTDSNSVETADIDWETEEGRFGDKFSTVRAAQGNLDIKLRSYDDDELDLDTLVDLFISEARIKENVFPQSLIEEYIRPNLEDFLSEEIGDQDLTSKVARQAMDALCDTIQTQARNKKKRLKRRVKMAPEQDGDWKMEKRQLDFVGYRDRLILCDAAYMKDRGLLDKVVTVDSNHMYDNRKKIEAILGIRILLVKDEFADDTSYLTSGAESKGQDTD